MKSETKNKTTETTNAIPSFTYCEALELVCECAANNIVSKDEQAVLSLTEHLMQNPEDSHYLNIELRRAEESCFVQ